MTASSLTLMMVNVENVNLEWSGGTVSGRLHRAGAPGVLLAHGAGTDQDSPRMAELREGIAASGLTVMTFNYPYSEAGRSRPDPQARLLDCHRGARDHLSALTGRSVVLAGRSMGGRMGTYLAAAGEPCLGLVCYAYPLHPAGRPENLRVDHLAGIKVPMLFFQGMKDPLSRMDLFDKYVRPHPGAQFVLVDANHSLGGAGMVPMLVEQTVAWIRSLLA
ncbi:MAG: alpha/beta hydrolase family protein [Actinomycetota bacterium]